MRLAVVHDLAQAEPKWSALAEAVRYRQADAVIVTGNATPYGDDEESRLRLFHRMLDWLATLGLPVYVIPGHADTPERAVLQAMLNHEIGTTRVQSVHGIPAFLDGEYVVCGFGGVLVERAEDPEAGLAYPLWRAEFALHVLRRLEQLRLLVLHGGQSARPETAAHLIKEYAPRFAAVGGSKPGSRWAGDSLVVIPGAARDGRFALVDLVHRQAELLSV